MITNVGLFRTAGRAAVAGSVVGRVQRKQQLRFATEDAAAQRVSEPVAVAAPVASVAAAPLLVPADDATDHKLAQLKQLGELRTAGVLTEEEFISEKAKVLAR